MTPFRQRSRAGRLAFALVALLAGCSTAQLPPAPRSADMQWDIVADWPVVMLRVEPGDGAAPVAGSRVEAQIWSFVGEAGVVGARALYPALPAAPDWQVLALPPGRHVMQLRATPESAPQTFAFTTEAVPASLLLGGMRRDCAEAGGGCRLLPVPVDAAEALAVVPAERRESHPLRPLGLQPYPPRLAALRLPPPTAPAIRVDPGSWLAAVDWEALLVEDRRSEAAPSGRFSSGGDAMAGAGYLIVLAVYVPILLVAAIAASEQRRAAERESEASRERLEALQAQAERLRLRAAEARATWSACEATVAEALSPDRVGRHLAARLPRPPRAASTLWEGSVTRVVLRHCGAAPDSFGVEVATRWTARRPGEAEPAYDAQFSRWVEGATPDRRLRQSERPGWEAPVLPDAACRPLAAWCADGGAALLDEVLRGVTGARDAIAATR